MSLIFQALRSLENEIDTSNSSTSRSTQSELERRAARPLIVWWLFAGILSLVTLTLAIQFELPERLMLSLAAPVTLLRAQGSVDDVSIGIALNQAVTGKDEPSSTGDTLEVLAPEALTSEVLQQQPAITDLGAVLQEIDIETEPETSGVVRVDTISPTINTTVPTIDTSNTGVELVETPKVALVDTQSATGIVSDIGEDDIGNNNSQVGRFFGSGEQSNNVASNSTKNSTANSTTGITTEYESESLPVLNIENRAQQQAKTRKMSVQISLLTAELIRAVQTGDEPAIARLLGNMESEVGADSIHVLNMQAYVALTRGQYAEVETLLARVLARDENDVNAGLNLAVVESRTGRLEQARQRLKHLGIIHPDDERIVVMLQSLALL